MSDLYLVLRHRLDDVRQWVTLGSDVMREARKELGLSYEAVARQVPVSSKTYERYEKDGRVPRDMVTLFANILGLEIETPTHERVRVVSLDGSTPTDDLDALAEAVAALARNVEAGRSDLVARLERIESQLAGTQGGRQRRARA